MKDAANSFAIFFERLGRFFDLFDLSFFVSGAAALGAVAFLMYTEGVRIPRLELWFAVLATILACYVAGLLCFAVGRWFRMSMVWKLANTIGEATAAGATEAGATEAGATEAQVKGAGAPAAQATAEAAEAQTTAAQATAAQAAQAPAAQAPAAGARRKKTDRFNANFTEVLHAHGLEDVPEIKAYLTRPGDHNTWRLYVRLWADIRQVPELAESLSFLNRYWVMAATYDGMTVALVCWMVAAGVWSLSTPHLPARYLMTVGITALLSVLAWACCREAGRYAQYQVEELVAVIASYRDARGAS